MARHQPPRRRDIKYARTPPHLAEGWWRRPRTWLPRIAMRWQTLKVWKRWLKVKYPRSGKLLDRAVLTLLLLSSLLLPAAPNPVDFADPATYLFVWAGLIIGAVYIGGSTLILMCARWFRRSQNPRRNLTLWLQGTRTVAVGGGIAVLAAAMALVPTDPVLLFVVWVVVAGFLQLWGSLFMDGAFAPPDLQPVSEKERIDAAIALQKLMSEANATMTNNKRSKR